MTSAKESSSDQAEPDDSAKTGVVDTAAGVLSGIAQSAGGLMKKMPSGLAFDLKGKASAISSPDNYVELKDRLSSWWHGTDDDAKDSGKQQTIIKSVKALPGLNEWTPERFRVVQEIWGEGYLEPGGPPFARKLLSAAKIDSKQTVLDMSLKLGGTASLIAKDASLYMEAWEPKPEFAKKARSLINSLGLVKRILMEPNDCSKVEFPENKYDLIYSREQFFKIEDKKSLIEKIGRSLKPKGQFLFTDLMVCDPDNNAEEIATWASAERQTPYPWTEDLYKAVFKEFGFSIWASNDFSQEYLEFINAGWHKIMVKIEDGDFDRRFVDYLMQEGEIWLARARAIESGILQVKRMQANPPQGS